LLGAGLQVRQENMRGFSLIEVMITLVILVSMTIVIASTLQSGIDVKRALSQKSRVTHRLQSAMDRLTSDLEHAFIIANTDTLRNGTERRLKGVFKIEEGGEADKLMFTTYTNKPRLAGEKASSATYVVYEVKEAPDAPGRKHLFRGQFSRLPEDFRQDPPMQVIAKNIQSLNVEPWRGDDWSKDKWDSSRSEWRNKLPRMVRITLSTWLDDIDEEGNAEDGKEKVGEAVETITTVVTLPYALEFEELRSSSASPKFDRL
jgi:prepilin-type N-terminal cleavage/methylation domain-containing protein